MTTSAWLAFTPRDTVFIRDGRSFDAAVDAVARPVLPGPPTMAGAVGAAFGIRPGEVRDALEGKPGARPVTEEIRGPVLARRHDDDWQPYFPFPADLAVTDDVDDPYVYRLLPRDLAGETDLGSLRLMVPPVDNPVEPLRGWIPGNVLARYLAGELPEPDGSPLADFDPLTHDDGTLAEPFCPEQRVGLAREGRTVRPGYLYQAEHLRFDDDWAFLAEYTTSAGWDREHSRLAPFGGRGRLADVGPAVARWPQPGTVGRRVLVYLATSAVWPGGWRMPKPDGAVLVAAVTGEPEAATTSSPGAGWERSRALRWAVPAGSVYLLEFGDDAAGAGWAGQWHGKALDRGQRGLDLVRTAGFGVALTGVWSD